MASRSKRNGRLPLIIAGVLVAGLVIGMWWLGQQVGKAPEGEVRIPVEGGL